ncbi:N-acetylglucosamine-6-phosphate deacetylase [Leptolyngbya sp. NIES-2104]|uniref:N-acetylglucosamine-6-phosphate deacetylase n=1 Tax=Leptolyngbya sp. NIES-2104 TaxID=1552121 RepID=UPI0006ECCE61|nr:N-acetylglucosamine-6-phosphate deacetylase [Leptolyngbya sp. NIES-2104]GAP97044.1 N-acetylglucosamine-6-phosphate deacetylase [Leptolyngbya sp. NIES-2104]
MRFLIINARVPGFDGVQQILIDDVILEIAPQIDTDAQILDVAGDWISLGGVDLQINGALGLAFPDLDQENSHQLEKICQFLWNQGIDGFLPTIVTTSIDKIQRSLSILADSKLPQTLGVHLEGPFLNVEKRGAHPEEFLLPLTVESVKRVLGDYAGIVKVMTLAPELDPSGNAIAYLKSLGITVSLGHSQATAAQAQRAFEQGASMVTHAFNAMPSLHHREPGLLGAAIANPTVYCGLIADGQHVTPIMIDILLRASQYDRGIFLVSDALSPLGLLDGRYPWDAREIEVTNGTAKLPNGTLAGTTRSLFSGVENLVKWHSCDLGTAIALATTAPRTAIDLPLYLKQPANLLRWQDSTPQRLKIDSRANFM